MSCRDKFNVHNILPSPCNKMKNIHEEPISDTGKFK